MKSVRFAQQICILFLLALALGCAKSGPDVVPVSGKATRNGEPVPGLFLEFQPDEGRGSWGTTNEQGQFTLEYSRQKKGARVGKHTVTVSFRPGSLQDEIAAAKGTRKLPKDSVNIEKKYGSESPDRLRVEISKRTSDLELKLD